MASKQALELLDRLLATERELKELMAAGDIDPDAMNAVADRLTRAAASLVCSALQIKVKQGTLSFLQAQWFETHARLILVTIEESQKPHD